MPLKLKTLIIKAFRGIPDLELNLDGKSEIIRGDNGSGKSSLVDAIEFFFTGSLSSLKGTQGLSFERHAPHVSFSPDKVSVTVYFDPGNISLSRTITSPPTQPPVLKSYFEIAQKGTCILRRAQLLEFIISQPADRFRAISNIIGIQHLDDYELMLKGIRDHFAEIRDAQEIAQTTNWKNLQDALGKIVSTDEEILSALNAKLQLLQLPKLSSLQEIDQHSESLIKRVRSTTDSTRSRLFEQVVASTKISLPDSAELVQSIQQANDKIRNLLDEHARKSLALKELLTRGQEVLKQWETNTCPLCGQTLDTAELNSDLQKRLETIASSNR